MLVTAGHTVKLAYAPQQAIELAGGFAADVALLDIGLPDMDGYELAQRLTAHDPRWRGRLIALTGYGAAADKEKAAQAGFSVHLTKPVDVEELLDAIERIRQKHGAEAGS